MSETAVPAWLAIARGDEPLIVSIPHAGTDIPAWIERRVNSPWLARKDADWWVDRLYDFAESMGATIVRTLISRTVIDVNRDPSGASLYPGQTTTELCPVATFDGEAIYRHGEAPDSREIAGRRATYFDSYHAALSAEVARLRARHRTVVVYDGHSIRSVVPRLFDGVLPHFNIGTNDHRAADAELARAVETVCDSARGMSRITNGRFKGGYITRSQGRPAEGVHAIQMELATRSYIREPAGALSEANWPAPYDEDVARPARDVLVRVLETCLEFAKTRVTRGGLRS